MASPESKAIWKNKAIAGGEFLLSGASLVKAVQTLLSAGISGTVAIWGALGILVGIDAKNRWSKQA